MSALVPGVSTSEYKNIMEGAIPPPAWAGGLLARRDEIQIRDERITDLKETLNWTRGELAERGRQHELLITSIPQMLPAPKGDRFWDRLFGRTKKE